MTTDKAVDLKNERNRTSILRQLTALRVISSEEFDNKWQDIYGSEPPSFKKSFPQRKPTEQLSPHSFTQWTIYILSRDIRRKASGRKTGRLNP